MLFAGELDWEASHELVSTIDTVVGQYFYTQVELIVASPGGETRAFQYYLGAVEDHRKQGVRFRTRVISSAESAAAVMVSLGDERVAEPGAALLYHHARVASAGEITARATPAKFGFAPRTVVIDLEVRHERPQLRDRSVPSA